MCESLNLDQKIFSVIEQEDLNELYEHYEQSLKHRKLARKLKIPIWFDGYFVEY